RNLLGQVGGGNDLLRQTDVVIGQEGDAQQIANEGIPVDDLGKVVDELDDQLCLRVVRRRLAGEYFHPRYPIAIGLRPDRVIERDRFEEIEQLALVFVDAFDLHIEQRIRVHVEIEAFDDQPREGHLVGALGGSHPVLESAVLGVVGKTGQLGGIVQ